ncbi:UNVERIFIED_CONTAM: hypothetical protein RMT77_013555 [Armadillidium vulgare]
MSFKNYICFFTFTLFVSAMADTSPSSEDYASLFEVLISSSEDYLKKMIAKSPEAFEDLREKLPEVIQLANEGKFEEAGKLFRSLPVIGDFFGEIIKAFDVRDFNEVYEYVLTLIENYGIEN